jgi:SAM-dependent methyltransferase
MKTCNYCGSNNIKEFIFVKDRFSKERFLYNKCKNCGLIFLDKIISETDIMKYYPENYEAYKVGNDLKINTKKIRFVRLFCENCSSILDVGCSSGDFLKVAKENGFKKIAGIEINSEMAKIASESGIEIIGNSLFDIDIASQLFDVITLWDVFEHLPEPKISLERINTLLKEDGVLIMSIPNLKSFDRFLFKENWIGWDAPRHFFLFDQKLLRDLLNKNGFYYLNTFGITGAKGAFNLSVDKSFNREISKTKYYSIISLLLWPYRQIGYFLKRCPVITVVARKRSE